MYNFNAGPSILPQQVIIQASEAVLNFNNTGLSLLEIGHRTPAFEQVMHTAQNLVKELMGLHSDYEVLFLHGGATTQFMQVPFNLLPSQGVAAYTDTGVWAHKAIQEAQHYGKVHVVSSSREHGYTYIPKNITIPSQASYIHITSNNTIYGTQWHSSEAYTQAGVPIVADMSSDIMSRVLDYNAYGLIYAGAQKNMGAAGVNVVIINKNILGKANRHIPTILDYKEHIDNGSMLNTPPVMAVYIAMLTLQWIKDSGGIAAMEVLNNQKAALLYNTIDSSTMYTGTVTAVEDRSKMNVCFTLPNKDLEAKFIATCTAANIVGIKGYRTVGGCRVSLYNALPLSSVQYLVGIMSQFELDNKM